MEINTLWIETPRENCRSVTQLCPTLCNPMGCSMPGSLSFTISWSLLKLISFESMMPFDHLILCHPLFLLPSIFPSIRAFTNESALHIRWTKYWNSSFGISPYDEYSRRREWFKPTLLRANRRRQTEVIPRGLRLQGTQLRGYTSCHQLSLRPHTSQVVTVLSEKSASPATEMQQVGPVTKKATSGPSLGRQGIQDETRQGREQNRGQRGKSGAFGSHSCCNKLPNTRSLPATRMCSFS